MDTVTEGVGTASNTAAVRFLPHFHFPQYEVKAVFTGAVCLKAGPLATAEVP